MASEPGVGVFGPIGVAPAFRRAGLGTAMLHGALAALRGSGYRRALIAAVGEPSLVRYYERAAGARVAERFSTLQLIGNRRPRVVVLASGNGSNFQAVADAARDGRLPIDIVALICNKPQAYAIARAADAGIKTDVLTWQRDGETRARYDERLLSTVSAHRPDLVLLLGWMHLLDARFVRAFPNAIVNVHPAFLPLDPAANDVGLPDGTRMPAFRGAHAVADALAAGCRWTGATVHVVTADTDRGPVLTRRPLAVSSDETQGHVLERLHPIEHRLVESAILRWLYER
jgi:phosphoribosylglycinamide formyltransferase-1